MPLYDCCECGLHEAGYWHCRDKRDDRKLIWKSTGKMLGLLFLGVALWYSLPWVFVGLVWLLYKISGVNC